MTGFVFFIGYLVVSGGFSLLPMLWGKNAAIEAMEKMADQGDLDSMESLVYYQMGMMHPGSLYHKHLFKSRVDSFVEQIDFKKARNNLVRIIEKRRSLRTTGDEQSRNKDAIRIAQLDLLEIEICNFDGSGSLKKAYEVLDSIEYKDIERESNIREMVSCLAEDCDKDQVKSLLNGDGGCIVSSICLPFLLKYWNFLKDTKKLDGEIGWETCLKWKHRSCPITGKTWKDVAECGGFDLENDYK